MPLKLNNKTGKKAHKKNVKSNFKNFLPADEDLLKVNRENYLFTVNL